MTAQLEKINGLLGQIDAKMKFGLNLSKKIHLPVLRRVIIHNDWNGIREYE